MVEGLWGSRDRYVKYAVLVKMAKTGYLGIAYYQAYGATGAPSGLVGMTALSSLGELRAGARPSGAEIGPRGVPGPQGQKVGFRA